jgi:hypothetical protein
MRLLWVLASLALAASPVLAQAPTPASSVEVALDPGPVGIPLGGSHAFPFQVTLGFSNVVCTQLTSATVSLSIKDLPSPLNGVTGAVPATLTFDVPQGNYAAGVPGLSPYEQTLDAELSINVSATALADHEHTFEVTANFDGTVTGCQGLSAMPSAEGKGEHQIKTGPASAAGSTARGATQTQSAPTGDSKDAPGPGALLIALALVVLARRLR